MPELIKTKAVVLNKLDYGDTSKIANLYSLDHGRISVIVKGARSPRSKIGKMVDVLNEVEIVFYKKQSRDVQLVSQVELISHFPVIKDDLDRLKFSSAVMELMLKLTSEEEPNIKIYSGLVKILNLMNDPGFDAQLLFVKYFLFFLKEIGYGFEHFNCSQCKKPLEPAHEPAFNYDNGFFCDDCKKEKMFSFEFSEELFNAFICLNTKQNGIKLNPKLLNRIIYFLEKYLTYHISEFKGISSFHMF